MTTKKHIIIYSHGFGVRKDDNGLLSNIAEYLTDMESVLFDYYDLNEVSHELLICPTSQQVNKLNKIFNDIKQANPGSIIDLIAHSQGTIVAAMARPNGIRKAILLAPVFDMGLERTLSRYRTKPDAKININGTSIIPSLNGLTRIIPKEYWQERLNIRPFREYNAFAQTTEMIIIEAKQDELLPKVDMQELNSKIKIISLDGDHGFSASARGALLALIKDLLQEKI
jgi:hypothetical protein